MNAWPRNSTPFFQTGPPETEWTDRRTETRTNGNQWNSVNRQSPPRFFNPSAKDENQNRLLNNHWKVDTRKTNAERKKDFELQKNFVTVPPKNSKKVLIPSGPQLTVQKGDKQTAEIPAKNFKKSPILEEKKIKTPAGQSPLRKSHADNRTEKKALANSPGALNFVSPKTKKQKTDQNGNCMSPSPPKSEEIKKEDDFDCLAQYKTIVAGMDKKSTENKMEKRYTMFLPNAFKSPDFTEWTITQLYGMFDVVNVSVIYDEQGCRVGCGTMQILENEEKAAIQWAKDFPWKALKTQPWNDRRPVNENEQVTLFLKFLPVWIDEDIEKKLRNEYAATKFQKIYRENGEKSVSALVKMDAKNAAELDRKLRIDNKVFNTQRPVRVYEVVENDSVF